MCLSGPSPSSPISSLRWLRRLEFALGFLLRVGLFLTLLMPARATPTKTTVVAARLAALRLIPTKSTLLVPPGWSFRRARVEPEGQLAETCFTNFAVRFAVRRQYPIENPARGEQ